MTFKTWIYTFLEEKGIDLEEILEVEGKGDWGTNFIPIQCLVDAMLTAPEHEQEGIKRMLVHIDFYVPGLKPVIDYLKHLAQAIAL